MLEEMMAKGEGERLDFKQKLSGYYKIAKILSAFANTKGGTLLIGVRDDKTISGIDPHEEIYSLETAANFYCDPPVNFSFYEEEDEEEQLTVLVVKVKESQFKPHYIRDKNNVRHIYIRQHDKCVPAGKKMVKIMEKSMPETPINGHTSNLHKKSASLPFNEKKLLKYLEHHEKITLKEFMQMVNISKRRASRLLTDMTTRGLIRLHEHEQEDYYTL